MFTDEYRAGVTVKSSWKTSRKQRENGSQTNEIRMYEAESQSEPLVDLGVQTSPLEELLKETESNATQNYDAASLAAFLSSVEPMITKQLKKNFSSNVFEDLKWGVDDSNDTSIACEYTLSEKSAKIENDDENPLEVTSLSWSSNGGSVAVAYGSMKPMPWGQAKSYLCVWNLDRAKVNPFKCDQKLEVESSLQTVCFHPSNPALIAAGLFSGSILLWDISVEEVVHSTAGHEDPVTAIKWLESKSRKYLNLVSASTDGKLVVWKQKIHKTRQPLEISKTFRLKASSVRSGAKGSGSVGVTCCAVSVPVLDGISMTMAEDRTLIAGCENGAIVKCSIDEDNAEENPVVFSYESHDGPVYSVNWSPFHRHIFLTCSTDQKCRIYHSLHSAPLREVNPQPRLDQYLFSVHWSYTRPLTVFSAGGSGILAAYDVSGGHMINSVESEGSDGKKRQINCLELNKKRPHFVATGNEDGIVHVWQLGSRFTASDNEAKAELDKLAEGAMTEE